MTGVPTSAGEQTSSVSALLERGREQCMPLLRESVAGLADPMDTVAAYHFGWIDAHGQPAKGRGGKAVRPTLALLSARAAGADPEVGVRGAVAVELVHNFSLLHDDLMDGDTTRRHRATAWTVYGSALAILTGDALLALASEVLLHADGAAAGREGRARAVRLLTTATSTLIRGQARDLAFERRDRISVAECQAMESDKTAALLACSCAIGAALAGGNCTSTGALSRYGYHLGLAFQAVDDFLGIWGDSEITGKPLWSDLRRRKKSLPVCAALEEGGPESRKLAELLAVPDGDVDEPHLAERAALIEAAGGRDFTLDAARRSHERALAALEGVPMPGTVHRHFEDLADFVVRRTM
ncbi:polyprenyl synthetase family protein [Streptomyces massasporeus]|uniref:polyprenyl synthetase family protein n=1 Tax=Streptomyces massasporeus TaxID=67324 RepID=UPI0037B53859